MEQVEASLNFIRNRRANSVVRCSCQQIIRNPSNLVYSSQSPTPPATLSTRIDHKPANNARNFSSYLPNGSIKFSANYPVKAFSCLAILRKEFERKDGKHFKSSAVYNHRKVDVICQASQNRLKKSSIVRVRSFNCSQQRIIILELLNFLKRDKGSFESRPEILAIFLVCVRF